MNSVDELIAASEAPTTPGTPETDPSLIELLRGALRDSWPFLGWLAFVPWFYHMWLASRLPDEEPVTSALLWGLPLFLWWAADMFVHRLDWWRILLCVGMIGAWAVGVGVWGRFPMSVYLPIGAWVVYWTRLR